MAPQDVLTVVPALSRASSILKSTVRVFTGPALNSSPMRESLLCLHRKLLPWRRRG